MSGVFGDLYSDAYDDFYVGKDYDAECDMIEALAGKIVGPGPYRLLDLGCGTGNHALPLARRGHTVVGVDRSPAMLERARRKALQEGVALSFHEADIRAVSLQDEAAFDIATMMFAVLGYQTTNQDALDALRAARNHLRQGGAFVFDVWFGPAVLDQKPERRFRAIPTRTGEILRAVESSVDVLSQVCTVSYELWSIEKDRIVGRTREDHGMRFYFPLELDSLLSQAGFKLEQLGRFESPEQLPDSSAWNVVGLARAV
ncbi:MAG: class I SAM-dependent methyltransferase [Alphaproteobacteria bacterium]|nr:class I SAM-dependent methyltransferase [Alphaproteobacteria bacterium]